MRQYLQLLQDLVDLSNDPNEFRGDRTGTGTFGKFGHQMRFNLNEGFPLLTTKKVHMRSIIVELLWFLRGDTNIRWLLENKCTIWTEWPYKKFMDYCAAHYPDTIMSQEEFERQIITDDEFAARWGELGPVYGHQWRSFGNDGLTFDQISWLINEIKTNPNSRRLIVTGWNPHDVSLVALPPCHTLFQFFVKQGKLSCQLYQRKENCALAA